MPRTALTFPRRKTVENMLTNGDFEYAPPFTAATTTTSRWIDGTSGGSGVSQGPYGWGLFGASLSTSAQFDTAQTKTGQYSLKLSTLSANRICTVCPQIVITTQGLPIALPNTTYNYSFWMKTNKTSGDSAGAYIDFLERNGAGNAGASHLSTQVNTTTDWTYYSGSFTTASTCRFIAPKLFVEGNTGTATLIMDAWFDDITLVKSPVQTRTAVTFPQRKTPDNLLSNGNFEYAPPFTAATTGGTRWIDGTATGSGNTESPYGWWTPSSFVASAAAQYDTTVYRSGTTSLKLSTLNATGVANAAAGNNTSRQTAEKTMVPALPNTTYTLTGWVKTNNVNTNGAYIDILEYTGTGTSAASNSTSKLSGTNDWTQLTKTFTTASNARFLYVVLRNNVVGNVSDAWFDDITLTTTAPYRNRKSIDNLVENGDFESAPTFVAATTASGWIIGTAAASTTSSAYKWRLGIGAGTGSVQFDNTVYKNGTGSMKISTDAGGWFEVVNANTKDFAIPVLPSTSYTLTGWIKTEFISGSSTNGARIFAYEYSGSMVGGILSNTSNITTTTDWTQYSVTFTTASTARFLVVGSAIRGNTGTGTLSMNAWFDDITLVKN